MPQVEGKFRGEQMYESPSHRDLSMRDLQPQPGDQLCYVWAGPNLRPSMPPTAPPTPDTLPNGEPAPDSPAQVPSTKPQWHNPGFNPNAARPAKPTFDQVARLVELLKSDTTLPDSFKLAILRHALGQLSTSSVLTPRAGLHDVAYANAQIKGSSIVDSARSAIGGGPALEAAPAPPAPGIDSSEATEA
ncbi:MAG: hypothetical protein JWN72_1622 [Thermoleophilia bacterium]|nr:hypothetical protein [Thermoleophilia bacterium]